MPFFQWDNMRGALKALTTIPGWQWDALKDDSDESAVTAYLSSAWLMRAVQVRAEAVPVAPVILTDREGDRIDEHPLLDLLQQVNDEWNASDLWRYTESGLCLYGAGYWLILREGNGRPAQLRYLNPSNVEAVMDSRGISGFRIGKTDTLARPDVVYFRGQYDPASDLTGLALAKWAARAAVSELNSEKYLSAFFKNNALPSFILSTDQQLPEPEVNRITAWLNKTFRGPDKAHKLGVMWGGLKATTLGYPLSDLALKDVRDTIHQTISTALGVPELLISPTNASDLTPVQMAQRLLYENTIVPRWSWYAEVLNAELVTEYADLVTRGARISFDTSQVAALQESTDARVARLVSLVGARIIRADVAAAELGFQPEDVPDEPEPVDVSPADDAPMKSAPEEVIHSTPVPTGQDELRAYRVACIAALKAGAAWPVPPAGADAARIANGLRDCKTASDVRRVFAAHWPADAEPSAASVLAELKAAREALTNA